jgi:metallo-beta-lactamase family protein
MKLKFLGAVHQVTGSAHFLEAGGLKLLVDCGLFQERHYASRNWDPFPVPPGEIDWVLLTHVHLDHSGLLPKLVKEGYSRRILLTPASEEMFPIVITDSARLQEEDAAFKKKRHKKEGRRGPHPEIPLYTVEDAERCFPLLQAVAYGEHFRLNDRVTVRFHDAGHILGSAMIEVIVRDGDGTRNVVFSGDIGQWNTPLLNDPSVFERADYVVMESTYGDRNHGDPALINEELAGIVNDTVGDRGNVLIPTFAVERAQELLFHFTKLARAKEIPRLPVFLDSPMAVELTKVYKRSQEFLDPKTAELFKPGRSPFDFPGLKLVESVEGSKAINEIKEPDIIMAGSGMITGGRIKHHLIRNITRPECTLLFVGYQAAGTLGRLILDGVSPVRILGQNYPVRIKIKNMDGFSAHAGMSDLERWLDGFTAPPKLVFLTHGEEESISSLAGYLRSKGGWNVRTPVYKEEYDL